MATIAVGSNESPYVEFFTDSGAPLVRSLSPALVSEVRSIDYSLDGTLLALTTNNGSNHGRVYVYETTGHTLVATPDLGADVSNLAQHVRFSPDGSKLAVAIRNSPFIRVFDTATWTPYTVPGTLLVAPGTTISAQFIAWSPDSETLVMLGYDFDSSVGVHIVYDYSTNPPTLIDQESVSSFSVGSGGAFSPDGSLFVSGISTSSILRIYETTGWTLVSEPSSIPASKVQHIEWRGNYIVLGVVGAGDSYVYDTTGSNDRALWTLSSFSSPSLLGGARLEQSAGDVLYYTVSINGFDALYKAEPPDEVVASHDIYPGIEATRYELAIDPVETHLLDLGEVEDVLDVGAVVVGGLIFNLLDALIVGDTLIGRTVASLIERVGVNEQLSGTMTLHGQIQSSMTVADRFGAGFVVMVQESFEGLDTWQYEFAILAALVDSIAITDSAAGRRDAAAAIALAMTFGDQFAQLTLAQILEILSTDDDLAARLAANVLFAEMIVVTMDVLAGRMAMVGLIEAVSLDDTLDAIGQFKALLSEVAEFEVELVLFGEVYQGWVVNTENGAPSEYQNFPFNSMARVGGRYFGAAENGLHLLDGDDDAGDPIVARVLTGETDFGSPQMKRVERAYMGYTTTGALVLKVLATVDGQLTEFWYRAAPLRSGEVTETRVPIGRGIASRYWQFEWVNVDGADFELDRIDLQVLNLSRRI